MLRLLNAKGQSSWLVVGSVHPSKYSARGLVAKRWGGLLGLGCLLVGPPCFQLLLVVHLLLATMWRGGLLVVTQSTLLVGSQGSLPFARLIRSILPLLVVSSVLGSVVAKMVAEVTSGLLVPQHGVGNGGRAQSV